MIRPVLLIFMWLVCGIVAAQHKDGFDQPGREEPLRLSGISTAMDERDFALSPDGKELFYTIQYPKLSLQYIVHREKLADGTWSQPKIAPFSGRYRDMEPAFSYDGQQLFFSSNRPVEDTAVKDLDIWMVEKEAGKWGSPKNLGAPVNTSLNEFYPSVTREGNLYFTAAYSEGVGKEDIYCARREKGGYSKPKVLDTNINSSLYEFNAFVSPEEDFIIFSAYGRGDDKGKGDLYMSIKDTGGRWKPAFNLSFINSGKLDYCPFVSFDRSTLYFTSERLAEPAGIERKTFSMDDLLRMISSPGNGNGDIYQVSFQKIIDFGTGL